jgi:ketosteroid isomerase-like protein
LQKFGVAFLCLAAVTLAVIALRPTPERELEAAYAGLDAAMRNRDLPAFLSWLAPDYIEKRLDGKEMSRAEAEANYRQLMQNWTHVRKQRAEIYKLTVHGNKATVTAHRVTAGDMTDNQGTLGPKGKAHTIDSNVMEIDTWTKTAQGWRMKTRQIAMAHLTIDGKVVSGAPVHDDDEPAPAPAVPKKPRQ